MRFVASDQPADIVAKLRASGASSKLVFAVASALIAERQAQQRAEIIYPSNTPHWKFAPLLSVSRLDAIRALDSAKLTALEELLGEDPRTYSPEEQRVRTARYGELAEGKADRLESIKTDYWDIQRGLLTSDMSEANRAVLRTELTQDQRTEIERLLTPAELEDFDMRNSPVSMQMRARFQTVDITQDEYRQLFRVYQQANAGQPVDFGKKSPAERDPQMQTQILAVLGPERYAEYLKAAGLPGRP